MNNTMSTFSQHVDLSQGRKYPEVADVMRNDFQRDRDRIVHATAFRRLVYKTQVFTNVRGDHVRSRMTHSIEVAQIARIMARQIGANEDLTEAIALAHDIGHAPFGHAGQTALQHKLSDLDKNSFGFNHNVQSFRIVDRLARAYPQFPGLNLTFETREALLKHCSRKLASRLGDAAQRFLQGEQAHLEAQICDLADQIAYNHHDIDDGVRAGILRVDELVNVPFFADCWQTAYDKWHTASEAIHSARWRQKKILGHCLREMLGLVVRDAITTTKAAMQAIANDGAAVTWRQSKQPLVRLSPEMADVMKSLRTYLRVNLYQNHNVARTNHMAEQIITDLFTAFLHDRHTLPHAYRQAYELRGKRAVADYIAGMTDRYALDMHRELYGRTTGPL